MNNNIVQLSHTELAVIGASLQHSMRYFESMISSKREIKSETKEKCLRTLEDLKNAYGKVHLALSTVKQETEVDTNDENDVSNQ